MSWGFSEQTGRRLDLARAQARRYADRLHLHFQDRRFWVVQALVIAISISYSALEATRFLTWPAALYLIPVSTYFVPATYAALNFGLEGAVPTALWCWLLTAPNIVLFHRGAERLGVNVQLAIMLIVTALVALRVDREAGARLRAQAASQRLAALNADLAKAQADLETYVRLATDALEEERQRTARDLHDDTIQALVIIKGKLETVSTSGLSRPSDRSRLEEVNAILARTIVDVRRLAQDLRPSLLDDLGLVHAMESMVAAFEGRTDASCSFHVAGTPDRLSSRVEVGIYRIVQEALRNVEKHSGARRAQVTLEFSADAIAATVTDDGHGFAVAEVPALPSAGSGLGLRGMRERAKLIGGTLNIRSHLEKGAVIEVRCQTTAPDCSTRGRQESGPQ